MKRISSANNQCSITKQTQGLILIKAGKLTVFKPRQTQTESKGYNLSLHNTKNYLIFQEHVFNRRLCHYWGGGSFAELKRALLKARAH